MTYGIEIYDTNGGVILDSSSKAFGIVDVFQTAQNSIGSRAYPQLAGSTIDVQVVNAHPPGWSSNLLLTHSVTVSYSAGYPVVSWGYNASYVASGATYASANIFIILKTTQNPQYGISINNVDNELILSEAVVNYSYSGVAQYVNQSTSAYSGAGDYIMTATFTGSSFPIPFIENLEGQSATLVNITQVGNTYTLNIAKTGTSIPRVLCFTRSQGEPLGYGLVMYDGSGAISYDSNKMTLSPCCYGNSITPPLTTSGSTVQYTVPGSSNITLNGNLPVHSATFMTGTGFYGSSVVDGGGYSVNKGNVLAIAKVSGALYTRWVRTDVRLFTYKTFYPITSNTENTYRVYSIDITKYTI